MRLFNAFLICLWFVIVLVIGDIMRLPPDHVTEAIRHAKERKNEKADEKERKYGKAGEVMKQHSQPVDDDYDNEQHDDNDYYDTVGYYDDYEDVYDGYEDDYDDDYDDVVDEVCDDLYLLLSSIDRPIDLYLSYVILTLFSLHHFCMMRTMYSTWGLDVLRTIVNTS